MKKKVHMYWPKTFFPEISDIENSGFVKKEKKFFGEKVHVLEVICVRGRGQVGGRGWVSGGGKSLPPPPSLESFKVGVQE